MEGSPKAFPRFTNMMWKLALFMYVHTTYENITIHLRLTSGQPKQIVDFKNYKQLTSIWLTSTFEAFLNPHHWLHKLSPCIVQVHLGVNPSNKLCVERKKKMRWLQSHNQFELWCWSSSSWSNSICGPKKNISNGTSNRTAIFQSFWTPWIWMDHMEVKKCSLF